MKLPKEFIFDKELIPEQQKVLTDTYEEFCRLNDTEHNCSSPFHVDDEGKAVLPEGTLLHGLEYDAQKVSAISATGVMACEFFGGA